MRTPLWRELRKAAHAFDKPMPEIAYREFDRRLEAIADKLGFMLDQKTLEMALFTVVVAEVFDDLITERWSIPAEPPEDVEAPGLLVLRYLLTRRLDAVNPE